MFLTFSKYGICVAHKEQTGPDEGCENLSGSVSSDDRRGRGSVQAIEVGITLNCLKTTTMNVLQLK